MKWTKKDKTNLLKCKDEADLQKYFPDKKISSLMRTQRKFRSDSSSGSKIERSLLLPDFHYPLHDKESWEAVKKFMVHWKPHRVVLMGDALEMRAIDHWKRDQSNKKYFEGRRLLNDYRNFTRDILEPIERLCPNAEKIYLGGNHEEWAYQMIERMPELEGMIEPELAMNLEERGWKWIPYKIRGDDTTVRKEFYKIGKLSVIHGNYLNKYHAAKTSETHSKSVCYGHTHDVQVYTKVHEEDPSDYHTAQSIGCLCNMSPSYLGGRPNRWVHAFGALYTRPSGLYNLYVPIIIAGKFVFEGKLFSGNKK